MKAINNFINESVEQIKEGKETFKKCPGWSFSWISTKDRWAMKGSPKMSYHLMCIPDDKTKDIVVFRDFAWYTTGYDQGHNSSMKYYLSTITGYGAGNGGGRTTECEPMSWDLEKCIEHIDCYLNDKKDWSEHTAEKLKKAAMTYDRKTKKSEIKRDLQN